MLVLDPAEIHNDVCAAFSHGIVQNSKKCWVVSGAFNQQLGVPASHPKPPEPAQNLSLIHI
eukprot:13920658-Alexandrium_andersonii.AAC.1